MNTKDEAGITLRDRFAAAALAGLLSRPMAAGDQVADELSRNPDKAAAWSFEYADSMIAARAKAESELDSLRARVAELEREKAAESAAHERIEHEQFDMWVEKYEAEKRRADALDRDYQRIIREVLSCEPRPARDRPDDQLEPPWEVIARVRAERDALAKECELLREVETYARAVLETKNETGDCQHSWNLHCLYLALAALDALRVGRG